MPFSYYMSGTPFGTKEEALQFRRTKIQWASDAMSKWSHEAREALMQASIINDDIFQAPATYDALVLYYFDYLKPALAAYLKPLPEPVCDVAAFCKNIEEHMNDSHDWALTMFDYYRYGYYKHKNHIKLWERQLAKRLKARAWVNKMMAKPKTRARVEQAATEVWADLKASISKAKKTAPKNTLIQKPEISLSPPAKKVT